MKDKHSRHFQLSIESLRALGNWCADCAEMALPVFEEHEASDLRPREAIEGVRLFAAGGRRTAQLRTLALAAFAASREAANPAAASAAKSAGLAASSAYTHPLADVQQTKHIVGPAAHAALALELDHAGDLAAGSKIVLWAIEHATVEVRDILLHMPDRKPGKSRLARLMYQLDTGIRARSP